MKKNARLANNRNRRRRNALALPLAALLGAALLVLPTDAAKADDFGFSLNLGCFSLNIGSNDDCRACAPPVVAPAPAPRPLVVAPAPAPRPLAVAPGKAPSKAPAVARTPAPSRAPAVVRGQAPNANRNARATYSPVKAARAPRR